jgi:hypothetical protein
MNRQTLTVLGDEGSDTMDARQLGQALGHQRDWVYRQLKVPGSLVQVCALPVDGRPRWSRKLLERELARRARSRVAP